MRMAGQGPQQAPPEVQQVLAVLASPGASEDQQMQAMVRLGELMNVSGSRGEQANGQGIPGMPAAQERELDRLMDQIAVDPDAQASKGAYPRVTELMALQMERERAMRGQG